MAIEVIFGTCTGPGDWINGLLIANVKLEGQNCIANETEEFGYDMQFRGGGTTKELKRQWMDYHRNTLS
jgi:hypothetical protein